MKKTIITLIIIISFIFCITNVNAQTIEDGAYVISSAIDSNKVVDLPAGSIRNGNNIQLYSYNDSDAQTWNIKYNSENDYYIITSSKDTNYSLDIVGGSLRNGSNVQLYRSNNSKAQQWTIIKNDDNYYSILTIDEEYSLDIPGGNTNNGANVQIYKSNNSNAQKFSITKKVEGTKTIEDGIYTIENNTNKLISIENNTITNNASIITKENEDLSTQKWIIKYLNNGYYSIMPYLNKLYTIQVKNNQKTINANIELLKKNNSYSERWIIKENEDKTYSIISKTNGLYLDSTNDNLTTIENNELDTQKFTFNKLDIEIKKLENGDYVISSSVDPNKVVDLAAGLTQNGSNIQLYSYNGTKAQQWNIKYNDSGYYIITSSKDNNYSFDIVGGAIRNNSNIQLYRLNNSKAQQWDIIENEDGYYSILTKDDEYSLDLPGGTTNNGTNIQLYKSNNSNAQKFSLTKELKGEKTIEDGIYKIVSNGKVLTTNNTNLEVSEYINSTSQKWMIKYLNNGYYSIKSIADISNSINVVGNKKVSGTNINVYANNNTGAQRFIIKRNEDNTYSIIAKNSGLSFGIINNNVQLDKESTNTFTFEEVDFGEETISNGTYFITTIINKNSSLTTENISDNSNVYIYSNNSTNKQKWQFKYIGNGYYVILNNENTNYALTALDANPSNIVIKEYNELPTQKWIVKKNKDNTYTILNKKYNAIDLYAGSVTNKNNIALYGNNDSNSQKFILYKTASGTSNKLNEDGYYFITSSANEEYVLESSEGNLIGNGVNVRVGNKTSKKNQKWRLEYISNGYYRIESGIHNSIVLDIAGGSQTSGANVQTWSNNGSYAQQWILKEAGDGLYYLVSNCGELYLDYNNENQVSNVTANTYTGETTQKFKLQKTRLENLVIDISAHNGNIDWNTVKNNAGIYGVILRVAAGSAYEDSKLAYNVSKLKELNIPYGIYIFSYAENQNGTVGEFGTHHEAKLEALRVLNAIEKYNMNPTLGIYYDLEVWENGGNKNWNSTDYSYLIDNFNGTMEEHGYPNWKIYANLSMANTVLSPWQDRITWIAEWNNTCHYQSYYNIWQYTSTGSIPGINGNVDLNIYFIS